MVLSIIVPVYNGEKYLRRCLDSIIVNLSADRELIIIDDGSTDQSGVIAEEYAKDNSNVKVIHQINKGLVVSRSVGIECSKGKYISFVDADDWIEPYFFDTYISQMECDNTIDISISATVRNDSLGNMYGSHDAYEEIVSSNQAMRNMCHKRRYHWYLWGKVYRREILENIIVDDKVVIFEDLDRNWQVFSRANKVYYSGNKCYHYFQNTDGMTESRCKINENSMWVFKRILNAGIQDDDIKQCMVNFYYQVYMRLALELYYTEKIDAFELINKYQQEVKQTISATNTIPLCVTKDLFIRTTGNTDNCIEYFAELFRNIKKVLLASVDNDASIYVYGTGVVALYVAEFIKKHNIKIRGYVVSDGQLRKNEFCGEKVYYLSEITSDNNIFLLAVATNVHGVITELLQSAGHENIFNVEFPSILF